MYCSPQVELGKDHLFPLPGTDTGEVESAANFNCESSVVALPGISVSTVAL